MSRILTLALSLTLATPAEAGVTDLFALRAAIGGPLVVEEGRAEVVRIAVPVATVVLGDPRIAAANVVDRRTVAVSALAPGETNVILLDGEGATVGRVLLRVVDSRAGVRVRRAGAVSAAYDCRPACRRVAGEASGGTGYEPPDMPSDATSIPGLGAPIEIKQIE